MPQIHAFVSRDAAHGWNGLAVRLGVSTSGLIEAVGQLLAESHLCEEDVPEFDKLTGELADRARTIDALRRQRKGRLLGGLVPAGATAAIVRAARVAAHRPVASASAGVLAIATVGGATAAIDRMSPPFRGPTASASGPSSLPTAHALDNGPNVLPVPPTTTPSTPLTTTTPSAVPPSPTPTTSPGVPTTTSSPPAAAPAPATTTVAPPATATQVTAGPTSASVSAGSSSAQIDAQAGPVEVQASVTPSSASVSAQTPVAQAQVTTHVPAAVSSTTSGVVEAVKDVAGSVLGS